jgi:DNA replication protein DnaC
VSGVYAYILEYQPDNPELDQFLTSALQAELDKRHLNRQMWALRQAGFPTKKRFEDLLMDDLPQDGRDAIPALKALAFLAERRNVILIGNSGTGKTHMAIAIGIRACEENYRVSFRTAAGLINEMIEARNENRLSLFIKQFKKGGASIIGLSFYISITGYDFMDMLRARASEKPVFNKA